MQGKPPRVWLDIVEQIRSRDRSDCWIYPGGRPEWYPAVSIDGKVQRLNRAVLAHKLGRPLVAQALHTCDQARCFNPDHLYEGTQIQNVDDCRRRGRLSRGIQHPNGKLSDADVVLIRSDPRPSHLVAASLGVSGSLVRMVRLGSRHGNQKVY